jgi:hypothetical protein
MTFVGPRPEYVEHLEYFTEEERQILSLKPGLTGLAQIKMHKEEDVLADVDSVDEYYVTEHLHNKLALDLEYLRRRSFLFDLLLVLKTLGILINSFFHFEALRRRPKRFLLFLCDIFLVGLSYYGAFVLRYDWPLPPVVSTIFWQMLPAVLVIRGLCFFYFGLYRGLAYYFSISDILNLTKAVVVSSLLIVVSTFLMHVLGHPRTVFIIDMLLVFVLTSTLRFAIRATRVYRARRRSGQKRTLLVGPVELTEPVLRQIQGFSPNHYDIVGLVDESLEHIGSLVHGVRIVGSYSQLMDAIRLLEVRAVFIADTPAGRSLGERHREELNAEGVEILYTSELHRAVEYDSRPSQSSTQFLKPNTDS